MIAGEHRRPARRLDHGGHVHQRFTNGVPWAFDIASTARKSRPPS
jgi:hypothetical protein